jgi:hypothetical protein
MVRTGHQRLCYQGQSTARSLPYRIGSYTHASTPRESIMLRVRAYPLVLPNSPPSRLLECSRKIGVPLEICSGSLDPVRLSWGGFITGKPEQQGRCSKSRLVICDFSRVAYVLLRCCKLVCILPQTHEWDAATIWDIFLQICFSTTKKLWAAIDVVLPCCFVC